MANRIFVLALVLLCSACSMGDPSMFDPTNTTSAQQDAFRLAAAMWCSATDGRRCVTLGAQDAGSMFRSGGLKFADSAAEIDRRYGGGSEIRVLPTTAGDALVESIVHELGHHFGCGASAERDVAVSPTHDNLQWGSRSVTYATQDQLRWPSEQDIACATAE